MKRKGASRSTIAKYLTTFIELHDEISRNPRTTKVKEIIRKNRSGNHPFTMLKKSGVVVKTRNGLQWVGEKPSVNMVIQVTEMIHQYKIDLLHRQKSEGDMFRRTRKTIKSVNFERTLADDEQVVTISSGDVVVPKPFCKSVDEIEKTSLKDINKDDLNKWHQSYAKHIGEPSGIPIKTPVDQSAFVNHHEQSLNSIAEKPLTKEPELNWFQKFIKLIFKIK